LNHDVCARLDYERKSENEIASKSIALCRMARTVWSVGLLTNTCQRGGVHTRIRDLDEEVVAAIGRHGMPRPKSTSRRRDRRKRVIAFVDDGSPNVLGTVLSTAPASTAFRGVAMSPHD
jgi:hypothetical protein